MLRIDPNKGNHMFVLKVLSYVVITSFLEKWNARNYDDNVRASDQTLFTVLNLLNFKNGVDYKNVSIRNHQTIDNIIHAN